MASQQFSGNLKEEVICPICMDFLQDPATIDCGHNFCHKCIARIAEDSGRFLKCPLCNSSVKKTFRPNWLLVNLVKKIQAMGTSEEQPEGEELKCQKHGEKFYYFCEHDGDFLCVMCRESEDHRMHNASLIEEAAQNYQDIRATLHRSEEFQFLSPTLIPPHLEKKLSVAKSRHDSIIENMKKFEDNLQASGKKDKNRFLESMNEKDKQNCEGRNIKPGLSNPYPLTPSHALFEASFPGEAAPSASLLAGSRETYVEVPVNRASSEDAGSFGSESSERFKAVLTPVALDAASPHPDLILSQDLKTVTLPLHPQRRSEEPADQERFYPFPCVLGSPGISSGCQAWEAELQGGERAGCLVGVASELVCRRGCLLVEPLAGFWTLRITSLGCEALTDGGTRENLPIRPKKVGIFVDHELGEVVFFDSTTSNHIYTFHASFAGQIFPFFQLLYPGTQITLNP